MARTEFEYEGGVIMNSMESVAFGLWLDKQDFYMNTLEREHRIRVMKEWLAKYRQNEQGSRII